MTDIVFREDDFVRWGAGKGSNLSASDYDNNNWWLYSHILMLQEHPNMGVGIDYIVVHGNQMTFHMTDHTVQGPFTLPTAEENWRGDWTPATPYFVNDKFTINNSVYRVLIDHMSAGSFDPDATDGSGHNLYGLELTVAGALPGGGAAGQILKKSTSVDYATTWGANLDDLEDVAIGSPLDTGNLLRYDGVDWSNWIPSFTFDEISSIALGSPLSSGDYLRYDGSHWANHALTPADRRSSTVTALVESGGSATLDPTLGDAFTFTPAADTTITAPTGPGGSKIVLEITTSGTTSYLLNFAGSFFNVADLKTGKTDATKLTLTFYGNGTYLCETSRTPQQYRPAVVLAASGGASIDPAFGELHTLTPTASQSITCVSTPRAGERVTLVVTTSGTSSYVQTFSTNIKSTGTLTTGTVSGKVFVIAFVSDGTNLNEVSRTAAM